MTLKEDANSILLDALSAAYPTTLHVLLDEFGSVDSPQASVQWQTAGSPSIWGIVASHESLVVMYDSAHGGIALIDTSSVDAVKVKWSSDIIMHNGFIAVNANRMATGNVWLYAAIEGSTLDQRAVGAVVPETKGRADAAPVATTEPEKAPQPEAKGDEPTPDKVPEAKAKAKAPVAKA